MKRFVLLACVAMVVAASSWVLAETKVEEDAAARLAPIPVADDPEQLIHDQMVAGWREPPRRRWTIAYHPIEGLTDRSAWHIQGTQAWVRRYPGHDELDQSKTYEIDAVALAQNFGVIDFYVHECHEVPAAQPAPPQE